MKEENTTESEKELTISISKNSLWKYSTVVLLAIVVIGAFVMFTGDKSGATGNIVAPTGNNAPSQPSKVTASADDDAVLGDAKAPVTIIEFSDYQCPFCGRFWQQTLPLIKSEYIDTGKAKLIFRDFPLTSIHPMAQPASEAAECVRKAADSDEAYYEYHDTIFANQASLTLDNLKSWAKTQGFNIDSCLDKGEMRAEVQKDLKDATAAGGQGTPYFVINGQPLSGAQPFSAFQQIIESELKKA